MPPSVTALEERLRGRGTETEEKIAIRLCNAKEEMEYGDVDGNFDVVLTNDDIQPCFDKVVETLKTWFPELSYE